MDVVDTSRSPFKVAIMCRHPLACVAEVASAIAALAAAPYSWLWWWWWWFDRSRVEFHMISVVMQSLSLSAWLQSETEFLLQGSISIDVGRCG